MRQINMHSVNFILYISLCSHHKSDITKYISFIMPLRNNLLGYNALTRRCCCFFIFSPFFKHLFFYCITEILDTVPEQVGNEKTTSRCAENNYYGILTFLKLQILNLELWPLLYIVFNGFSAQLLFNRKRLHGIKKFCGNIMGMCILTTRYFRFKYFSKYLNIIYFEYLMCALSYIHHVAMSTNVMYVSLHTFSFIFNMHYIFDVCMIVSIFRFVPYFSTKFIFRLFLLCWLCALDDRNACIYRSNEFIIFY